MINDNVNTDMIREKILKGIEKAVKKLIERKQKVDGEIVFSRNGRIERIKASEI